MNSIGGRMFKGAAVGTGVGAVGGGIYGAIKAQEVIDNMSPDSVEISGGRWPGFQTQEHWDGSVSWKFTPGKAPDVELVNTKAPEIRAAHIIEYAAIGAVAGGVGGAIVAAAMGDKS